MSLGCVENSVSFSTLYKPKEKKRAATNKSNNLTELGWLKSNEINSNWNQFDLIEFDEAASQPTELIMFFFQLAALANQTFILCLKGIWTDTEVQIFLSGFILYFLSSLVNY